MNILFLNRSFYPDIEATGQFLTELCEDLAQKGHEITVIAGRSYLVNNGSSPVFLKREKYKSIDVLRTAGTALPKKFLLFRIINLSSYFLLAFIAGFFLKKKPNIVIAQTDPPVLGLLGIFYSRLYKAKYIYYCQDIYPEVGIITGRLTNPILNFFLKVINMISFKLADEVICIGDDMKNALVKKSVDKDKIFVVHNWADLSNLDFVESNKNPFREKYKLTNIFTIMYSGNIGFTQGLEKLVEVAKHFRNNNRIKFMILGDGAEKSNLQRKVLKLGLLNVEFLPYQERDELRFSLSAADVHLVSIQKGLAGIIVPSKVYSILACSKPFIGWADEESDISNIARTFNCGVTVSPGDVQGMIKAVEWALENPEKLIEMGKNGRKAVEQYFERKVSTNKFNEIIMK